LKIIVCVKHVPETAEAEIKIDSTSRAIEKTGLVFDINEWDDYVLEEAARIKEKFGGTITAITVNSEHADRTLRKCLARGADQAIRLTDTRFAGSDGYAIAKILQSVIKNLPFDLVLTGALASDDGYTMVGPILAKLLKIPHSTMVKKIEFRDNSLRVNRELEGGLEEIVEVPLPAVLTIQTGINEPRYVSIMGIRKAMKKEIKVLNLDDIDLEESDVGEPGSWIKVEKLFIPPVEKEAEYLRGTPEGIAEKITELLKSRGLI
jgi:electron transfer flavoprotein beta subunit